MLMNTPTPITPSWSLLPVSFELVKKHFVTLLYLSLLPSLLISLGALLIATPGLDIHHLSTRQELGIAAYAAGILWTIINLAPSLYFAINAIHNDDLELKETYKKGLPLFFRLLGVSVVFGVMIMIGLLLLIVPAIIVINRYLLAPYVMIKENTSILESFTRSAEISKGHALSIWGVIGVQIVLAIAGAFAGVLPLGSFIGQLIGLSAFFLLSLRFHELIANVGKTTASHPRIVSEEPARTPRS
jgi:hypothetical protein